MRKVLLAFALVLVSISSNAQKGMSSIGIDAEVGAGSMIVYGFDVKYQYNVSTMGRIEPCFSMVFGEFDDHRDSNDGSQYRIGVSYHQFLNGIRRNRFYLLLGAGYEMTSLTEEDYYYNGYTYSYSHREHTTHSGFVRGGFGYERKLSHKFSFQTEIAGLFSGGTINACLQVKIGATYNL